MSEEDQNVEVVLPVKSDMHSYSSTLTAKDVKALAFSIPPSRFAPGALTANGTMDKGKSFVLYVDSADPVRVILLESTHCPFGELVLWWKKRFFFLDRRAIPQAMAWRHHDSDIHDPLPTDGFRASDVEFSGFLPIFKDTEGNVVTMSEYLRFPFLDGATIEQGDALSARDAITSHTTGPLPVNQSLPEKTASAGGEGGSKGKPKRRKVSVVRAEEEDSTEEASSASPLRTVAPNPSFLLKDVDDAGTAESREDEHVSVPHHDSANTTHNYIVDHDESFGGFRDTERGKDGVKTLFPCLVLFDRSSLPMVAESSRLVTVYVLRMDHPAKVSIVDTPEDCRELVRAWFSIARGTMAQTDALLRFEALYDAHLALKERCEDRDELRAVNADQASHIKELEAELARKDSALVFSDRISNERAAENERLVSKLRCLEKEKIDSIGKLLPTVVRRLLNSHEYKESLSIPFNLAIQEDFPGLPRRTVQELLKMYPAPPPQDVPTKVNPSSQAPDSSKSAPTGANV
ncbi:hypothetical protein Tco_0134923 [Tanacetum coccineum]